MKRQDHGPHIKYVVRRSFFDDEGSVSPGYIPPPERVAKWINLAALVNSGYLTIGGERVELPIVEKKITEAHPKITRTTKKKIFSCPVYGCNWKGERVKSHLVRAHKELDQ